MVRTTAIFDCDEHVVLCVLFAAALIKNRILVRADGHGRLCLFKSRQSTHYLFYLCCYILSTGKLRRGQTFKGQENMRTHSPLFQSGLGVLFCFFFCNELVLAGFKSEHVVLVLNFTHFFCSPHGRCICWNESDLNHNVWTFRINPSIFLTQTARTLWLMFRRDHD